MGKPYWTNSDAEGLVFHDTTPTQGIDEDLALRVARGDMVRRVADLTGPGVHPDTRILYVRAALELAENGPYTVDVLLAVVGEYL